MAVNTSKVALGGVVAGLVMTLSQFLLNEVVLAEQMQEVFAALNVPPPSGSVIAVFIAITFVVAGMTMWLYAVMRPSHGAGPKTAVCAGLFVWTLYYLAPTVSFCAMGMLTPWVASLTSIWSGVEMSIAAVAGAYLYSD